jgi:hypothetical protein
MRSSLPDLELVINSGVRVLIYDGDAVRSLPVLIVLRRVYLRAFLS